MNRMSMDEVREAAERGESQRAEFKGDAPLDGGYKNHLCHEIAGMANGGGGQIFVGIADGPPAIVVGIPRLMADALMQTGYLQKLLTERMEPQPEVRAHSVDVGGDRFVVVIDVTAPWNASEPRFMPIVLTADVQNAAGRMLAAAGSVVVRSHDRCERVREHRQLDAVMRPLLDRYREAEIKPLLRAMLRQGLLDQAVAASRMDESSAAFPGLADRIAALQAVRPRAARYECRLTLDGVELSRSEQLELVDRASASRSRLDGPVYGSRFVRPVGDGAIEFDDPASGATAPSSARAFHEFWRLTPTAGLVFVLLDRADLMVSADAPPPGADRPIDPVGLAELVLGFVQFAANAASLTGARSLWVSIAAENVLERPMSRVLRPSMAIVDRIARSPLRQATSNRSRVGCEGEFDAKALIAEWREVAAEWNVRMFAGFGLKIDPDEVRRLHDELVRG